MNKLTSTHLWILGALLLISIYYAIKIYRVVVLSNKYKDDIYTAVRANKTKNDLEAVIYGVWKNSELVAEGALGESMPLYPANTNMHFRIGGVLETMLSTALMQLIDSRIVSLSDTINKWLPSLPFADTITLGMIANSTSGYPDYEKSDNFRNVFIKDVFKVWSFDEIIGYACESRKLNFQPGTNWEYSHTNYVLLGRLLELICAKSVNDVLAERIFNPLGMNHTFVSIKSYIPCPVLHSHSIERGVYEDSTFWSPSWTSYSGSAVSTIDDLGKWINSFGEGTLLSKNSYDIMMQPSNSNLPNKTPPFGMGFVISKSGWIGQNPRFGGYSGFFAYHPREKVGIIAYNTVNDRNSQDKNYSQGIVMDIMTLITPQTPMY